MVGAEWPKGILYWLQSGEKTQSVPPNCGSRPIAELVRERLDQQARYTQDQAERELKEWEAIPAEERARILKQFTRPDGSICEHWWQPAVEGW